jgi:hypothetical protein
MQALWREAGRLSSVGRGNSSEHQTNAMTRGRHRHTNASQHTSELANMLDEIPAQHRQAVLGFLAAHAGPVNVTEQQYSWKEHPWESVSVYGWQDFDITRHIRGRDSKPPCALIIPDGIELRDVNYSQFQDTFAPNSETIGLNAYGGAAGSDTAIRCTCGRFGGLMIRWEGSLSDILLDVLKRSA